MSLTWVPSDANVESAYGNVVGDTESDVEPEPSKAIEESDDDPTPGFNVIEAADD